MSTLEFRRQKVVARIRNPLENFQLTEDTIEIRYDPLLGHSMRITKPKGLDKTPVGNPLKEFVEAANACFFCEGKVETSTPMLPPEILPEGRISVGSALLFPNLAGFARYSGVSIFSKDLFIYPSEFTVEHVLNALKAIQIYFQKCAATDPDPLYPSVNANYLLPSGSSILHPHLQPILDPFPTNFHRRLLDASAQYYQTRGRDFWTDLKEAERTGPRFVAETAHTFWYTPFAPTGFNEINGIIGGGESYLDLSEETLRELAEIVVKILRFYDYLQHNSFNFSLFSPPVNPTVAYRHFPCHFKMVTRPVFRAHYRNDITFFERLHQESMLDQFPEDVAAKFREFLNDKQNS